MAGVGLSSQINYLIINAVIGLSTGGGILISQYYGAKKKEDMNKSIHVMISMLIVAGRVIVRHYHGAVLAHIEAFENAKGSFERKPKTIWYIPWRGLFLSFYTTE